MFVCAYVLCVSCHGVRVSCACTFSVLVHVRVVVRSFICVLRLAMIMLGLCMLQAYCPVLNMVMSVCTCRCLCARASHLVMYVCVRIHVSTSLDVCTRASLYISARALSRLHCLSFLVSVDMCVYLAYSYLCAMYYCRVGRACVASRITVS